MPPQIPTGSGDSVDGPSNGTRNSPADHVPVSATRRGRARLLPIDKEAQVPLRQQMQTLRDTIRSLEQDKATLTKEISTLVTSNQTARSKQATLQEEVEALRSETSVNVEKISDLEEQNSALEHEKQALATKIAATRDQVEVLESDKRQAEEEMAVRQQETQALMDGMKKLESQKSTLADEKNVLEKDMHNLEEKNCELQSSWARMEKDNARLRLAFENQLEKTRARSQEVNALSTQLSNVGEQLVILDAAKRDVDDSLCLSMEQNAQQASTILELCSKVKRLEDDLGISIKKGRDLESKVVGLAAEMEGLEKEIPPLQSANQKLTELTAGQQATILGLRTENERLDVSVKDARGRLEKLDDRSYSLTSELGKVTAERDLAQIELAKEIDGQQSLKSSLRKANAKTVKLETELEVVRAMMKDAQSSNVQLSETERILNDRVLQLQRSLVKANEATDNSKSTESNLRSEISALKAHLASRDIQKKELRSSLRTSQRALSDATDKMSGLETKLLSKDQRIESLCNRIGDEQRLRGSVTRELRAQRVKQKELESLQESAGERMVEAERKVAEAAEQAQELKLDVAAAKEASATLRQKLNEARMKLVKAEQRVENEQEGVRLARAELQEVNRVLDGLDPERTWRQLAEEKVARAADVARLEAEMRAREREVGAEKLKLAELKVRVRALEATASHDQCVEKGQVRDLVRAVGDLVAQCEVRPRGTRFEWSYPEQLVQRPEDNKWEIRFVKKLAVRRRW